MQFLAREVAHENEHECLQTLQMPLWRSYGLASYKRKRLFSLCTGDVKLNSDISRGTEIDSKNKHICSKAQNEQVLLDRENF